MSVRPRLWGLGRESRESQGPGTRPGLHLIIDFTVRETWVMGIDRETDLERLGASFIEMERREGIAVGGGLPPGGEPLRGADGREGDGVFP